MRRFDAQLDVYARNLTPGLVINHDRAWKTVASVTAHATTDAEAWRRVHFEDGTHANVWDDNFFAERYPSHLS